MKSATLRRPVLGLSALALLFTAASADGAAQVTVRVRGRARLEASARTFGTSSEVSGSLTDERGRPVSGMRISIRSLSTSGQARVLPPAKVCSAAEGSAGLELADSMEELRVRTDPGGRFCVQLAGALGDAKLQVNFDEPASWLDSTVLTLNAARMAPLKLAFRELPSRVSSEAPEFSAVLESRFDSPELGPRPATLGVGRGSNSYQILERGTLTPGQDLRFTLDPRRLGEPGAVELVAETEVEGERVSARAPLLVTGRANLRITGTSSVDSQGESTLHVLVTSPSGTIQGGSVEARVAGRTVGIAAVSAGRARLLVSLGATHGPVQVSLRYLSASPFWLPGPDQELTLVVPEPSVWRRLPGLISGLLIAAWIFAAWRRPPRKELPKPVLQPEPKLEWLPSAPGVHDFSGTVVDAHEGTAVAGAKVLVLGPSMTTQEAQTDSAGHFRFEAPTDSRGARIRVEAALHRPFEQSLPRPGRLLIAVVTRRRALLAQLVEWSQRMGSSFSSEAEPTPAELAKQAASQQRRDVAEWASAVESAAFGPAIVDAEQERLVELRKPER